MNQEKIRARHLKYFSQLAEEAEVALRGPEQATWHTRLYDERDNIRAALKWAAKSDTEAGLRLAGSLPSFWESLALMEGIHWLDKFLDKPESKGYSLARAKALYTKAMLLWYAQEVNSSHLAAQESLELFRACDDKFSEIDALCILAMSDKHNWNHEIQGLCQRALELSKSLGDEWRQAQVLQVLSWKDDDYAQRITHTQKALELFTRVGDLASATEQMISLAELHLQYGNLQSTQKWLDEAARVSQISAHVGTRTDVSNLDTIAALSRQLKNKGRLAYFLILYGRIAFLLGNLEEAYASLYKSIEISEEVGHRLVYLYARTHLAYIFLQQGETTSAHKIFLDCAQEFQQHQNTIGVAFALEGIARILVMDGKHLHAASLIGWADRARENVKDIRPPGEQVDVDKLIAVCLALIGEIGFSNAYDEGKKMSVEEAIAYALEET